MTQTDINKKDKAFKAFITVFNLYTDLYNHKDIKITERRKYESGKLKALDVTEFTDARSCHYSDDIAKMVAAIPYLSYWLDVKNGKFRFHIF